MGLPKAARFESRDTLFTSAVDVQLALLGQLHDRNPSKSLEMEANRNHRRFGINRSFFLDTSEKP